MLESLPTDELASACLDKFSFLTVVINNCPILMIENYETKENKEQLAQNDTDHWGYVLEYTPLAYPPIVSYATHSIVIPTPEK